VQLDEALLVLTVDELDVPVSAEGKSAYKRMDDTPATGTWLRNETHAAIVDLRLLCMGKFNAARRAIPVS
jgi:uncharacterized membrane protein YiaA